VSDDPENYLERRHRTGDLSRTGSDPVGRVGAAARKYIYMQPIGCGYPPPPHPLPLISLMLSSAWKFGIAKNLIAKKIKVKIGSKGLRGSD
jgi:hypothetical protein